MESAGGNATVGTIDATGMYHSPAVLPKPNSVTVEAVSVADKTLNGNVSVTLQNPIPVPQKVSPDFVPVGNFSLYGDGHEIRERSQGDVRRDTPDHNLCLRNPAHGHGNIDRGAEGNGEAYGRES